MIPRSLDGRTHYEGCWKTKGHHDCAEAEIDSLRAKLAAAQRVPEDAELDALVANLRLIGEAIVDDLADDEDPTVAAKWAATDRAAADAITALRRRVAEAHQALRNMPSVEHSNHFDATGGSGTGCPACIRQWDWRAAHSAAIEAARKGAADAE